MPHSNTQLRNALADKCGLLVSSAGNALAARVIESLNFEAVHLSDMGLTNNFYGMPDLDFVGLKDIAHHTAAIRDAIALPLVVDVDTGLGNALNVRTLERAGANKTQLEDQVSPKKCSHFARRSSPRRRWSARSRLRSMPGSTAIC